MTLKELRENVKKLDYELDVVFSDKKTKAACGRVRMILGDLKNATPELRRNLKDLDKK